MRSKFKKALAILASAAMCGSMLLQFPHDTFNIDWSLPAFAAEETACAHSFGTSGVCESCGITGGYCGASTNDGVETSVTWTLKDGTLTISGSEAMADYDYNDDNRAPWYSIKDSIQTTTIDGEITNIGKCAFDECVNLTGITIPDSVKSIGDYAFYANGFTSIEIPDGVTNIGEGAFARCNSLKSITIPGSVKGIGYIAFNMCNVLESVVICEGVESIGGAAFYSCGELTSITIPNSVTEIGTNVFQSCESLTTVNASCKWKEKFPNYENIDTFSHTKVDGYTAEGNQIYYNCENGCIYDRLAAVRLELASEDAIYYTGSAITPEVQVIYDDGWTGAVTQPDANNCTYSNNIEPGTATCTFTHEDGYVLTLDYTIRAIPTVSEAPTVADRVYDPSAALQDSDLTGGTVLDVNGDPMNGTWSWQTAEIVPEANNKGYIAVFTPEDTTYYDAAEATITVNVAKATPTVTAPTANTLTYNGEAKALVTAGNTIGGELQYKVDDGEWLLICPQPPTQANTPFPTRSLAATTITTWQNSPLP